MAHLMHLHQGSCGEWQPRQRPEQVITNPPWGNRLMGAEADDSSALEATWTELGLFLKVSDYLHRLRRIDLPLQGCWQHLQTVLCLGQAVSTPCCCVCVETAEEPEAYWHERLHLCSYHHALQTCDLCSKSETPSIK